MKPDCQFPRFSTNCKFNYTMTYTICGYLLLITGFFWALLYFYRFLGQQLYIERTFHLNQITEKIVQSIDTISTAQWEHVANVSNQLNKLPIQTTDSLTFALKDLEENLALKNACLLAFDEQNNYYSSSGQEGSWPFENPVPSSPHMRQMRTIKVDGLCDDQEQVLFIQKLSQPISINESGGAITHLALVRGINSLQDSFVISSFSKSEAFYIIAPDGTRIYRNASWDRISSIDNIVNALSHVEFLHGNSLELLKEDLRAKKSGSMEIRFEESNHFLSYAPMRSSEFLLLVFVPTKSVYSNSQHFIYFMLLNIAIASLVIAIFVFLAIYLVLSTRKANVAKSDFLSQIFHDVRTPIHCIAGMTEIAQKNIQDPAKIQDCLNKISASSDHLLMLVDNVLDMSKIKRGKIQIVDAPFNLNEVLDNCISMIGGQLAKRNVSFSRKDIHLKHVHLIGDALHLHQILINILINAVKFTPDGGQITLQVQETSYDFQTAWFRILIEDTGIGMSEEFQQHLFEPFMQEKSALYSNSSGTGLGMSIVKGLVDAMQGEIKVKSDIGKGTRFFIRMRFFINQETDENSIPSKDLDFFGMRVLLAEDHPINREIAAYALIEKGIFVANAHNGEEAVALFSQSDAGEFDAILMDLTMPIMDGFDATRAIRSLDRPDAGSVPIIAMSASTQIENVQEILDFGMNDYLAKPLTMDQLFTVLAKYRPSKLLLK